MPGRCSILARVLRLIMAGCKRQGNVLFWRNIHSNGKGSQAPGVVYEIVIEQRYLTLLILIDFIISKRKGDFEGLKPLRITFV